MKSVLERMQEKITFDKFKTMATDETLSPSEKIGFPDSYRNNYNPVIAADIIMKLGLERPGLHVLDVGCGCGELTHMMIQHAISRQQQVYLIDSVEMLNHLPYEDVNVHKINGQFPKECQDFIGSFQAKFEAILVYSLLQHIVLEANLFDFIDRLVGLLAPGGRLLLGDIPNLSKRNRFFASDTGVRFHQEFTNSHEVPVVNPYQVAYDKLDDGMIMGILQRYRGFGFESYLLPQGLELPFSNRREDIVIIRN